LIVSDDDPEGFSDLAHAYTLFAESQKKSNPEQRGRFNLGEKLVLALASKATISTTKGTVIFDETGRHGKRIKRESGSEIRLEIPITRAEHEEMLVAARRVIVPAGITTIVNGMVLPHREPVTTIEESLPTIVSDNDGILRRTTRKTVLSIYEPFDDEEPTLYEMGIPVVTTGDRFHIDVAQKVPLNMDRDNVTPAYLRSVRVAALNASYASLSEEDATATWIKEACSDSRTFEAALKTSFDLRFGENAVAYDPSDHESNNLAVARGLPLVHGGNLSRDEWVQARRVGVLSPAGQVTPSPKPYSEDGRPLIEIEEADWTDGMKRFAHFVRHYSRSLLGVTVRVRVVKDAQWPFLGTYGFGSPLVANLGRLGHSFFDEPIGERQIDFLIHEFGHHFSGNHRGEDYVNALTRIGARSTMLALRDRQIFDGKT
jgi:hypothetical protein